MTRCAIFLCALLYTSLAFGQEPEPVADPTPVVEEKPKPKPKPPSKSVRIVYPSAGCLDGDGSTNINLIRTLFDYFKTNRGGVTLTGSGLGALSDGPTFVFPANATDGTVARVAVDNPPAWEVAAESIPILISPYEVVFQYPFQGHFDWLSILERETKEGGEFEDTKRVNAKLLKAKVGEKTVFKLEMKDVEKDPIHLYNVVISSRIDAPDDSVEMYMLGRNLGRGARIKPALDDALAKKDAIINMLVHPGGFVDVTEPEKSQLCAELIGHLNPMATVPRSGELRAGPAALTQLAQQHKLRFVAANLVDPKTDENVFRRFSVFDVEGMTIAVYGIVGEDQMSRLSAPEQKRWKFIEPNIALHQAASELEAQLQRKPDLTIVVIATNRGDDVATIASMRDADIVIGPSTKFDLASMKQTVELEEVNARYRRPSMVAFGTGWGVNEITAKFGPTGVNTITLETTPIPDAGPIDVNVVEAFRPTYEAYLAEKSRVLIPAIAPFVEKNESLHPLVWGDRIVSGNGFWRNSRDEVPRFTDPLWMRFVTNILRRNVETDLAVSRNLPRSGFLIGPLSSLFVDGWLQSSDSVGVVDLSGAEVLELLDRIQMQNQGEIEPEKYIFVSGALVDGRKRKVNGRDVVPEDPYSVAVTDHVIEMAELKSIFIGKKVRWIEGGEDRATLRDITMEQLDDLTDETGNYDTANNAAFENLLLEDGTTLETEYKLQIREISARTALYRNSNTAAFVESRETRLLTPNNFAVGGLADMFYMIDGRNVGWTLGTKSVFDRVVLDTPAGNQASERADDILVFTEFDINAVKVNVSEVGMPLVPFIRTEFDSEFTATPDPATGPDAVFPHQKVLNFLVGAVLYPGRVLREIRLAPIARVDFSEAETRTDFGVRLGYDLRWRIASPILLESNSALEYLFPDDDDRASDLSLRMSSKTQLVMPIWRKLSFIAFVDLFYAIGATPANDSLGGSVLTGGGFRFSDVWRF